MRYCIALLHTPTVDGRVVRHVDCDGPVPVMWNRAGAHSFIGSPDVMVAVARNVHVRRNELICSVDLVVGSSESLTITLDGSTIDFGVGMRPEFAGRLVGLRLMSANNAWPSLNVVVGCPLRGGR